MSSHNFSTFKKNFHGCICTGYGRVFCGHDHGLNAKDCRDLPKSHFGANCLVVYIPEGIGLSTLWGSMWMACGFGILQCRASEHGQRKY